jgi:predicted MPP superfamily phosphohydrolase
MGAMIGKKRISEMIDKINAQKPDIVLLAGDLVDHNPLFMKFEKIGPEFLRIKAPMGVYAVAGNHEFIGHADVSIDYLQQYGVQYIRDTLINVKDILQIAGRDDRERRQHDGAARKPIDEVMQNINPDMPLILMDHQPVEYKAAAKYGVDLMVSGHTHKGQLWPFGYITNAIFENDYGLMTKGNTHYYTSSGYGTWGPPVRTGNRPELVVITVKGK